MKFQRTKVAKTLAYLLGVGGAMSLSAAYAQSSGPDIRVEVTGSNIKRVEGEGALPVQAITKDDIEKQGIVNAAQLLDRISANMSFNNYAESLALGDAAQPGFAGASLRGLGYNRTLVLINGRRLANYALNSSGVDLNSIPIAAIERVEILKDGASAVYGSDAIAGVINFITRTDYRGVDLYAYYGDSDQGGGDQQHYSITGGWGDLSKDRFNVFATFDYQENGALAANQRKFASTSFVPNIGYDRTSGNSFPANIGIPGVTGTKNPLYPQCAPPQSFPTPASPNQCRYDYASVIDIIDPAKRYNAMGKATFQINPDNQAFVEGEWSHNEYTFRISPVPISNATTFNGDPFSLQPSSPYYPRQFIIGLGGDPTKPINVLWRSSELGPRTTMPENDQYRIVGGLQGNVRGWDYGLAAQYNESKVTDKYTSGWVRESVILPILNSGVVNPFGANTPDVLAQLQKAVINQDVREAKGINYSVDGKVSNEIYKLPAGPLAMAVGAEYRKESLEQTSAEVLNSGDILGSGGNIPTIAKNERNVTAVFAEFNAPIVKNLEANLAVRFDHYSDFGSTTNPKFSLRYTPVKELLLRASWGKGFRAPDLQTLYQPLLQTNTAGAWDDPLRCPVTQSANDCTIQFNALTGGNPALKPERSTQYSFGGVWEPVAGGSIAIDYWWVEIKDVIAFLTDDTVFNNFNTYASSNIVRGPVDPAFPNLPGPIRYVLLPASNYGKQGVDGIDVDASYRFPATAFGRFKAMFNGTYTMNYKQTQSDGSYPNFIGQRGNVGAIPRWRHSAQLNWEMGPWGATLDQVFQQGYDEPCFGGDPSGCDTRHVGAYSVFGVQGQYTGFKNLTLALGIRNMFDTDPPLTNQNATFQVGYDPTYADPRGRFFYGSVRYSFR